jgi:hypothetical protein
MTPPKLARSGIGDFDGLLEQIGGHHSFHGRVVG